MKRATKSYKKLPEKIIELITDEQSIPRLEQLRVKEYEQSIEPLSGEKLILIPWSGGLDSTTSLLMALESSNNVITVFFNYGQPYVDKERARTESILAKIQDSKYSKQLIEHIELDVSWLVNEMTSLFPGDWAHIFPMRNMIIILLTMQQSDHDLREVWFGAVQGEIPFSGGDKSEIFIRFMREYLIKVHGAILRTPLMNLTKGDMVNWAKADKFRMDIIGNTISCFDPDSEGHCSKCQACFNRAVGFNASGALELSGIDKESEELRNHARSYQRKFVENSYYSNRRREEIQNFIESIL